MPTVPFTLNRIRPGEVEPDISYSHDGTSDVAFTVFYGDPGRRRLAGVSDYGPGTIKVSFPSYDEVLYVLEGEATVRPEGAEPFDMRAGDAIYFTKGTVTEWIVREKVRDIWCVIADSPLDAEWARWFRKAGSATVST